MTEQELKLFRLALNEGAQPGEADAAALKLIQSMRRRGASAYDPAEARGFRVPEAARDVRHDETVKPEVYPGSILMPFGKHAGKALATIPPDYLRWCVNNFDENDDRRTELIKAMAILLDELYQRWRKTWSE